VYKSHYTGTNQATFAFLHGSTLLDTYEEDILLGLLNSVEYDLKETRIKPFRFSLGSELHATLTNQFCAGTRAPLLRWIVSRSADHCWFEKGKADDDKTETSAGFYHCY